jgi:hypothetical protein
MQVRTTHAWVFLHEIFYEGTMFFHTTTTQRLPLTEFLRVNTAWQHRKGEAMSQRGVNDVFCSFIWVATNHRYAIIQQTRMSFERLLQGLAKY